MNLFSLRSGWRTILHTAAAAIAAFAAFAASAAAVAADVPVAVAANFAGPIEAIAKAFEAESGHKLLVSTGATGKFYAQIRSGAPFEVLLSADQSTPAKLIDEGLAAKESRFTYAIGRLVLWSTKPGLVDDQGAVLSRGGFERLAIADPALAPYGAAAVEVMKARGVYDRLQPRLVIGSSIAQAQQFVDSGNAELGFVALSQVIAPGRLAPGSMWRVPASLHAPLQQDAVLLKPGQGRPAAAAFLAFLRSAKARELIAAYGYETE
jgi:molybdate transport system substrate-binding protein